MVRRMALGAAALGGAMIIGRRLSRGRRRAAEGGHASETPAAYRDSRRRILILGAGFGGLATALGLDRLGGDLPDTSILVVDRNNDLLFAPLLWIVANGRANASDVMVPVRAFQRGRTFHLLTAGVQQIDLDKREVTTSAGVRPYDYLVIAVGSLTAIPDLPGLRQHARIFHSPADALQLRNYLIEAVEAAHEATDPAERRAYLTFVVAGGGDTGIELAATIHSYLVGGLFARYPWLADAPIRIIVVGHAERLVPMSTAATSEAVRHTLEAQGIEVLTGVGVRGATDRTVLTDQGEIPARTLFWAAGITAPPLVHALAAEHARNGALQVDDHLRLPGHPEVYAVGDVAWAFSAGSHDPIPPTAQAAEHEGAYVARAIAAQIRGVEVPPFQFKPAGHLALLGNNTGVAEIGPFIITGPLAWVLWHSYYLWHIPSWRNRLHLVVDWLLSWLTGPDTSKLPLGTTER